MVCFPVVHVREHGRYRLLAPDMKSCNSPVWQSSSFHPCNITNMPYMSGLAISTSHQRKATTSTIPNPNYTQSQQSSTPTSRIRPVRCRPPLRRKPSWRRKRVSLLDRCRKRHGTSWTCAVNGWSNIGRTIKNHWKKGAVMCFNWETNHIEWEYYGLSHVITNNLILGCA